MKSGCFYGIGVGPGDPELLTVKAVKILARCGHVFVPRPAVNSESLALNIAREFIRPDAQIHELEFPMTTDPDELSRSWSESAREVLSVTERGEDACFLTLGDALLYSTYIYLLRELRALSPGIEVVAVPGVTSFAAAAALTDFPLGEGREQLRIIPAIDDMDAVSAALAADGTIVLMKIGKRLQPVLRMLQDAGRLDGGVFVARAGQTGQIIETNLEKLKESGAEAGYMSVILSRRGKNK